MELPDKRDLYHGFGDGLARAFELAVTPAVFGLLGFLLDRRLGITPVLTLVFSVSVMSYMLWRVWKGYEAQMKAHEANRHAGRGEHPQ